jgi:DNA-binding MarR family transcriptional regulator
MLLDISQDTTTNMLNLHIDDPLICFQIPHYFIHQLTLDHRIPAEFGINKTELRPLMALRHDGPMTMQELGEMVGIPKGTLTSVVDRLIRSGLAQRSEYPQDRRKVLVEITTKGMKSAGLIDKDLRLHLKRVLSVLSADERDALFQSLQTIHSISTRLRG